MIDFEPSLTKEQKRLVRSIIRKIPRDSRPTVNEFLNYIHQLKGEGRIA